MMSFVLYLIEIMITNFKTSAPSTDFFSRRLLIARMLPFEEKYADSRWIISIPKLQPLMAAVHTMKLEWFYLYLGSILSNGSRWFTSLNGTVLKTLWQTDARADGRADRQTRRNHWKIEKFMRRDQIKSMDQRTH